MAHAVGGGDEDGQQHRRKVFQNLFGLLSDAARDELSRLRIDGYLTGRKQEPAGSNRLRVRPDGLRRLISLNTRRMKRK